MRKLSNFVIFTMLGLVLGLASCSPKDEVDPEEDSYSKPNDRVATAEVDEALDQVNDVINNRIGGGSNVNAKLAAGAAYDLPCGVVSLDSTGTGAGKTYSLNYGDKTQCGYKYKSGEITFALQSGSAFNEIGAVFEITFINYVVEVNATGSYVKLNGIITVENVNGRYVWEVLSDNTLTVSHRIRGTLSITYHDNTVRERKYYQLREWSSPGAGGWTNLTLSIDGDSISGVQKFSESGKTYEGNYSFATEVVTPFKWTNCATGTATYAGPYKLIQGQAKLEVEVPSNPLITAFYIEAKAGYNWAFQVDGSTPGYEGDCDANAYRIKTVINNTDSTFTYQLY